MVLSKKDSFFATYNCHQAWSFPDNLIYYMTKNPLSPKCYEKMIKSCKHFFIKNRIIVVPHLYFYRRKNEWKLISYGKGIKFKNSMNKIWVAGNFVVDMKNSTETSPFKIIIPKLYSRDIKKFVLCNQDIFFNDFVLLASKCKGVCFKDAFVVNNDGAFVALETVIENLPNATTYYSFFQQNCLSSKTFQKLALTKFERFEFRGPLGDLQINDFCDFIKKNKKTKIRFEFLDDHPSEHHKIGLQSIVDEIVVTKNYDYIPPCIVFHGMNVMSRYQMWKRCPQF